MGQSASATIFYGFPIGDYDGKEYDICECAYPAVCVLCDGHHDQGKGCWERVWGIRMSNKLGMALDHDIYDKYWDLFRIVKTWDNARTPQYIDYAEQKRL